MPGGKRGEPGRTGGEPEDVETHGKRNEMKDESMFTGVSFGEFALDMVLSEGKKKSLEEGGWRKRRRRKAEKEENGGGQRTEKDRGGRMRKNYED